MTGKQGGGLEWLGSAAGVVSLSLVPGSSSSELLGSASIGTAVQCAALALAVLALSYRFWRM